MLPFVLGWWERGVSWSHCASLPWNIDGQISLFGHAHQGTLFFGQILITTDSHRKKRRRLWGRLYTNTNTFIARLRLTGNLLVQHHSKNALLLCQSEDCDESELIPSGSTSSCKRSEAQKLLCINHHPARGTTPVNDPWKWSYLRPDESRKVGWGGWNVELMMWKKLWDGFREHSIILDALCGALSKKLSVRLTGMPFELE